MNLTLHVWRQKDRADAGRMVTYEARDIARHVVPGDARRGQRRLDREGRGADRLRPRLPRGHLRHVLLMINGWPHGPERGTTTCQLHMRSFKRRRRPSTSSPGGPGRSRSSRTWSSTAAPSTASSRPAASSRSTPAARRTPTPSRCRRPTPETAMDAAACIGCGACVAACPNASAMLFVAAKVSHLALLPQGQPERARRVRTMVDADGRGRVRQLHQPLRVRGRLPQGNQRRVHRQDESGIFRGGRVGERGVKAIRAGSVSGGCKLRRLRFRLGSGQAARH